MLSGSIFKKNDEIWAVLPHHLDTVLSRMLWMLASNLCTSDAASTLPSEPFRGVTVSTRATLVWDIRCSVSKVAWAAALMLVWKSERLSVFLLAGFRVMLLGGEEARNPNAVGCLKKKGINVEADILPTSGRRISNALARLHNLWGLIVGVSCSLESWEMVLTECRNLKRLKKT